LIFYDVLNTNCNLNPGIEVVHGEMMAFRRLALHLICLNLTNAVHMLISICYYWKTRKWM